MHPNSQDLPVVGEVDGKWSATDTLPVPHCVAVSLLLQGTLLTLHTKNSRYRLVVVDGEQCRVRVSGGDCFPEETEALVVGAGDDGERTGWIIEGLRLELWTTTGRVLTSAIQSIDVES
jgi:hypothetical protein